MAKETNHRPLHRELHPEIRVLDEEQGLVEYVASDETLDSYDEIILADGWRFDERFASNPVFVDSHSYWGIADCIGRVTDWRVEDGKLIEVVQWAIDVAENSLAQLGFRMTAAGYLKAVSVGFIPTKWVHRNDDEFTAVVEGIQGLSGQARDKVRRIFQEQQQIELSACILGANPSALARAHTAGDVDDDLLEAVGIDDQGHEMLTLAARIDQRSDDPSARDLARMQWVNYARNLSPARSHRAPATSATGHGSAAGDHGNRSPRPQSRAWLKEVADRL